MVLITDKFGKSSINSDYAIATTVKNARTAGVTVLDAYDLSKFADDTPVFVITYTKTANPVTGEVTTTNLTSWKAIVNVGANTLTNLTVAPGYTDLGNAEDDFIECVPTSYWENSLIDGIRAHANDDGSLKTSAVKTALGITSDPVGGWGVLNSGTAPTVSTGYNKGNKSFDLKFTGVNLTSVLSPGMRFKCDRNSAAPTQCADFESTSSQYATKASPSGIGFTTAFTIEGWIEIESYPTSVNGFILNRENGTSGWGAYINPAGQVVVYYGAGSNFRNFNSIQGMPIGRKVHLALVVTSVSSATAEIYLNGILIGSYNSSGTATTLVQPAADLRMGAYSNSASQYLDARLSDMRLWSAARTATQIRDNMNTQLVGNETNLVGYWKLAGNFNDSTANANNLTANGGAIATYADHPFQTTEYGIIQTVNYVGSDTIVNVFTGQKNNIPNMTLINPFYSSQKAPFGFPSEKNNWEIDVLITSNYTGAFGSTGNWHANNVYIEAPKGKWKLGYEGDFLFNSSVSGVREGSAILSTTAALPVFGGIAPLQTHGYMPTGNYLFVTPTRSTSISLTADTTQYLMYFGINSASGSEFYSVNNNTKLFAKNAYA